MKKAYEKPKVIYFEKAEARAADCARADVSTCSSGPLQS